MLKRQDTIERDVVVFEFTKNSKPPAKPEPTVIEEVKIPHTLWAIQDTVEFLVIINRP